MKINNLNLIFNRFLRLCLLVCLLSSCQNPKELILDFSVGQVWRLKEHRDCERKSCMLICNIVRYEDDTILNVRVDSIRLFSSNKQSLVTDYVYLGFSINTFKDCIDTILVANNNRIPNSFYEHYSSIELGVKRSKHKRQLPCPLHVNRFLNMVDNDISLDLKPIYLRNRCDTINFPRYSSQ